MALFLVTGGAGFVGSNLVHELINKGESVRVLDNFSTGQRRNLEEIKNKIEVVEGDIRSYHIVRQAMMDVDYVLHQAALPSVPRSVNDPITSNEVNTVGTLNILDVAKEQNVKRVVFASSSSVYGESEILPKDEGMIPNPMSPYAVSKLAGENYCRVFSKIFGLKTVVLRYFNVFGPGQDPMSQYSAVIPKFIRLMKRGQSPVIYGDGKQTRDFTYVENVVKANLMACDVELDEFGEVFNCATHIRIDLNNLVSELNSILGTNIVQEFREPRLGDVKHSYADISKAKKMLGYEPHIAFREGLERTVESYV